jgi:hypothetical protein
MKKNYILNLVAISFLFLNGHSIIAQSVEDFETESGASTSFTDASQTFTISSQGENYNIFANGTSDNGSTDTGNGFGWNGSAIDNKFIDNSGPNNDNDVDGSNFTIATGGAEFGVTSLYLFCSTRALGPHSGNLTITGNKGGVMQYTFTKTSGFNNPTNFGTFNGFTFIDFATEGASDFTQVKIDELVFTSTGNLDYLALDAFSWAPGNTLSVDDLTLSTQMIIYPNPSSNFIKIPETSSIKSYRIYNILGNEINHGKIGENNQIDIRNFVNGLYFLHFDNGIIKKFIKK